MIDDPRIDRTRFHVSQHVRASISGDGLVLLDVQGGFVLASNPIGARICIWAVDEACVWYVKRAPCLQRSAVATRLLRRHGVPAELVIGYRPIPFESHAWVEVGGQIVNDRPQYKKFFAVLERL